MDLDLGLVGGGESEWRRRGRGGTNTLPPFALNPRLSCVQSTFVSSKESSKTRFSLAGCLNFINFGQG